MVHQLKLKNTEFIGIKNWNDM